MARLLNSSIEVSAWLLAVALASGPAPGWAQGHGPIYGLSTPTLGRGGWSVDVATMSRAAGGTWMAMLRPMLSYGITEDVQASVSLPMPLRVPERSRPVRATTRMPASPDVELLLGWRFRRRGTDVGSRLESTAYLGFDYPTDGVRSGVRTAPGVVVAAVAGYASRTLYLWAGGLYRRYMTPSGPTADHPGDLAMYSLVLGYRPPPFRRDYPRPDWRVFLEAVSEVSAPDVIAGLRQPDTGGRDVFLGPTLLGLYGTWGISGGPVFPVYRRRNGTQPAEQMRLAVDFIYWF